MILVLVLVLAEILLVCAVLEGLTEKFGEAVRRNDVKAIVLTGNVRVFCFLFGFGVVFVPFD
jgi:enoyl-CoA hydratase/carnithine racemase